ncbi:MAG: hypothetical protein P1P87_17410, partial [Trueperaceae bacterium]|nr:hypothetical protein [Trueperaceae bacterium]
MTQPSPAPTPDPRPVRRAPARLRARLGLLVVGSVVLALAATVVVVDQVFARTQRRALEDLLARDLQRVQAVVRSGSLGEDFIGDGGDGVRLQFVSATGQVLLPVDAGEPIPLAEEAAVVAGARGRELVGAAPWVLPSGLEIGTVRVALDLSALEEAQRALRGALIVAGFGVAAFAGVVALVLLERALRPLGALSREASAIDPSAPRLAAYRGPD